MGQDLPFEDLFHQINELLQFVAENADKPLTKGMPEDIEQKLSQLEAKVQRFKEAGQAYVAQLGVSEEDLAAYEKQGMQQNKKSSERLARRTEALKKEIERKAQALESMQEKTSKKQVREISDAPPQESFEERISISEQKELNQKSPAARKSLFKRVGGNKKWRPL